MPAVASDAGVAADPKPRPGIGTTPPARRYEIPLQPGPSRYLTLPPDLAVGGVFSFRRSWTGVAQALGVAADVAADLTKAKSWVIGNAVFVGCYEKPFGLCLSVLPVADAATRAKLLDELKQTYPRATIIDLDVDQAAEMDESEESSAGLFANTRVEGAPR